MNFYSRLTSNVLYARGRCRDRAGRIDMEGFQWKALTIATLFVLYCIDAIFITRQPWPVTSGTYLKFVSLFILHYRGGFRRTGASSWHNIILGSVVGAISGYYIFAAPLKDYWEDQRQKPHTEMGSKIAAAGQNSK